MNRSFSSFSDYSQTEKTEPRAISSRTTSQPAGRLSEKEVVNRRAETRVELPISLQIRRPTNAVDYRREVETENVSRNGARITLNLPLELGAELIISAFNHQFTATAIVCHVEQRWDGYWSIGLKFTRRSGRWIIC